ncbi:MAG: hypothetical protein COU69_02570 [Candidatus Pacebacteria bacterium CG10_big_fil_rev_8_21_14_0_10_56_10]|nr:MAG: hypothetical protein COU69_02570 [Candidatus Pacebacteria bacterium CG10_big_fil_rev_8_21_14_0_10_56_10]
MLGITELFSSVLLEINTVVGNLGLTLILFTLALRAALLPLTVPSIKAQGKMRQIQPELSKLQKKFGKNKQKLQKKQFELYKKHNVNPLAGCVPQIIQLGILIVLFRALTTFLTPDNLGSTSRFLWLDLARPDSSFILPVLAGASQFILALMIAPGGEIRDTVPNKSKSKQVQQANRQEEGMAQMAAMMQKQSIYVLPIVTVFFSTQFPAGLALYWVVTTVFSIGQQYVLSGPGGITVYTQRARHWLGSKYFNAPR